MDIFTDEIEYNVTHIPAFQRVLGLFEGRPDFQRIVRLGLMANMGYTEELDDTSEDDYEYDHWRQGHNNPSGFSGLSARRPDRGASGDHTKSSNASYPFPMHHYTAAHEGPLKESGVEKSARLFQEAKKKSKEKAEKKRLKKQKQKERKRLEKEKQNAVKKDEENDAQKSKTDENKPVNSKSDSSVKDMASANNVDSSDSSEDESGDEDSNSKEESDGSKEGLDMKSTFVSKAALIAQRKLEQKPRPENKAKEKVLVKDESKTEPGKPDKDPQDCGAASSPTYEDTIKISTDLANIGNKFASAGDFNMAVKYFTHAIKYNPTEFKLFGNRAFCFERMQEYGKALADAELSLSMNPGWVKGLFRKGRALAGLKRYEEAAEAFREVLKVDSSCAEAAQELMRVQITQVMEYGFTREQSSNALIIHGTVQKAVEVLSKLNHKTGAVKDGPVPAAQVANVDGVSPVLSANMNPQSPEAAKAPPKSKPSLPVPSQSVPSVKTQPKPAVSQTARKTKENTQPTPELFPIWVGNLFHEVSEDEIIDWFSSIGDVYSVKVLPHRRCAFVNFTKPELCVKAIEEFNGSSWNGVKIAVRYPDRIPEGMGFSKFALNVDGLQAEYLNEDYYAARFNWKPARLYRGRHHY